MPLPSIIDVSNSGVEPQQIQINGAGTVAANGVYLLNSGTTPSIYEQVADSNYTITPNHVTPSLITQWDLENLAVLVYSYDVTAAGNGLYCVGSWDVELGDAPAPSSISTQLLPSQLTPS